MEPQVDWSFARSPKWIVSHVGVLLLIAAMVTAGVWQINRHGERSERNDLIRARSEMAPLDIGEVAPPGTDPSLGEDEQFRRVTATGMFRVEDEVLIRNRTFEGAPGFWVLTPFMTEDGFAVAVNRGWIPRSLGEDGLVPAPPTWPVPLSGYVQPSRVAEGFQVADPAEGTLDTLARPNVERLAQQLDYPLSPVVFQLARAEFTEVTEPGGPNEVPFVLALPELGAGPHLSYAAQWFIFTTIAVVGYPLVLRRVSRGRGESLPED